MNVMSRNIELNQPSPTGTDFAEMAPGPIIIFGAPMSGTTYLREIVNKHPDVHITYETRVFQWMFRCLTKVSADDFALYTHKDKFLELAVPHLKELVHDFFRSIGQNVKYWGDKNPFYGGNKECLEFILSTYPETKFIHIYRDGRDVVTSLTRKKSGAGKPWADFEKAHELWSKFVTNGNSFAVENKENCLGVKYEQLVADDELAARKIFEFLGIDFSNSVLEFCKKQKYDRTVLSGPTRNIKVTGANSSEWRKVFTRPQQLASLDLIENELIMLGYETEETIKKEREKLAQNV